VRLFLDEHFSPRIAELLRAGGHDVGSILERGLAGMADRLLIAAAHDEGRALVTENVADLLKIAVELAHLDAHHSGIILTNAHRFPRSQDGIGRLVRSLDRLLVTYPDANAFVDRVVWLEIT
jgi:hypothetical protein